MPDVYVASEKKVDQPLRSEVARTAEEDIRNETDSLERAKNVISNVLRRVGEVRHEELWGAYCVRPGKRFLNEEQDEETVLLLRAHPITNAKWMLTAIVMLVVPGLLETIGVFSGIPGKFVFMGKLTWYLMTMGFAFEKFLNWYYSVFIVTNERVVDMDFLNLLYREVTFINLNHIEQPQMTSGGFIRSFFKIGDVTVSTAAEESGACALGVPHPDKVVSIISELSEELEIKLEGGKNV
jgi:hypothetical protein